MHSRVSKSIHLLPLIFLRIMIVAVMLFLDVFGAYSLQKSATEYSMRQGIAKVIFCVAPDTHNCTTSEPVTIEKAWTINSYSGRSRNTTYWITYSLPNGHSKKTDVFWSRAFSMAFPGESAVALSYNSHLDQIKTSQGVIIPSYSSKHWILDLVMGLVFLLFGIPMTVAGFITYKDEVKRFLRVKRRKQKLNNHLK